MHLPILYGLSWICQDMKKGKKGKLILSVEEKLSIESI